MRKYEINKRNSFLSTQEVMVRNESIWKADDVVENEFDQIRAYLPRIGKNYEKQILNGNSGTLIKSTVKTNAIDIAIKISDSAISYAVAKKDFVLEAAVKLNRSDLLKLPQATLSDVLNAFIKKVLPFSASLKHLKKGDMEKAEKLFKEFEASIPVTSANMGESQTATMNIGESIKTLNQMFLNLDKHIAPYKYNYPDFYNDYMNSRKVINLKGKGKKTKTQAA